MDLVSLEKGFEVMSDHQKEDGSALLGALDLNFAVDKEEKAEDHVHENLTMNDKILVDLNEEELHGSPSMHANFRRGSAESPYEKSHPPEQTEYYCDINMGAGYDDDEGRSRSPFNHNHCEGEMDSSSQVKAEPFKTEMETENSAPSQEFSLTMDANQGQEMEDSSDMDKSTSPPHDAKVKEFFSEESHYELNRSKYEDIEEEPVNYQTEKMFSSPRSHRVDKEARSESIHCSRNSPTESGKLDMLHPCQQSPQRTPKQSISPSTARQTSVSPGRSPCTHKSPSDQKQFSAQGVHDPSYSPRLRRQKYSSLPERSDLDKGVSSEDRSLPSGRQTSASPRGSPRGSKHRDGSSLKRMSASPKNPYSPPKHRRKNRSMSRSPVGRRDSSSGYKRDYRDRSRSRSPYTRDRHRRSPRRHSPRRRSPLGYHSRHRSPRRRPWSPPPNRSTGLGKPGKNLFVAGFSFLTTERDLERKFSKFGRVRDVRIVRDKRSGDSRGFGFLSLERDEDADAAIRALDKTEWNGRIILVEKSKPSGR